MTFFTGHTLAAGRKARGTRVVPQFLMVPLLSSLSPAKFSRPELTAEDCILERGTRDAEGGLRRTDCVEGGNRGL